MRISRLTWRPYRLPFAGAFGTAQAALKVREGFILKLETDKGLVGLGDAAPLPEFGGGNVADVEKTLSLIAPEFIQQEPNFTDSFVSMLRESNRPGYAATSFALETATFDLLAQSVGLSLAAYLGGWVARPARPISPAVPVNATIGQPDNEAASEAARQAVAAGFGCVKLKVGMAASMAGEVERVGAVRQAIGPDTKLRLDANSGWTVPQAIETLNALEQFDLELVEQPVAAPDIAGLAQVRRSVKIPIAADEPVTSLAAARTILKAGAADFLVIKPMVVGGLRPGLEIMQLARKAGVGCIVTTTLDSAVGIAAALHLAANLTAPLPYCGLATALLLTGPLVEISPLVINGLMPVPQMSGLGLKLPSDF